VSQHYVNLSKWPSSQIDELIMIQSQISGFGVLYRSGPPRNDVDCFRSWTRLANLFCCYHQPVIDLRDLSWHDSMGTEFVISELSKTKEFVLGGEKEKEDGVDVDKVDRSKQSSGIYR
jgi:hypothetical protein